MDKYIFNNFLQEICKKHFNGSEYSLAKAVGHIDSKGKVRSQMINNWTNKRAELKASTFSEMIDIIGFDVESKLIKK